MKRITTENDRVSVSDINLRSYINKLMPVSFFNMTSEEKVLYDEKVKEAEEKKRYQTLVNYFNCSSNVPERFKKARLELFAKQGLPMPVSSKVLPTGNLMEKANFEKIAQFCKDSKNHKGGNLWFCGGKGTGKTSLACAILYELCMEGLSVQYFRMANLMQKLEDASHSHNSSAAINNVYSEVCANSVCVIDEIGRYPNQQWEQYRLFELIDRIYNVRGGGIFITNLSKQEFADYLGEALTDRFYGNTTCFEFTGKSFRGCEGELYQ